MNERQLMDRISSGNDLITKRDEKALNGLMDVIHSELSSGGNVSLVGSGVFSVANRKARMVRNPKMKEEVEVKARKIPVLKMGSTLKRTVNNR